MPKVPDNILPMAPRQPAVKISETDLMMAAAMMHSEGKLFEPVSETQRESIYDRGFTIEEDSDHAYEDKHMFDRVRQGPSGQLNIPKELLDRYKDKLDNLPDDIERIDTDEGVKLKLRYGPVS